MPERYFVLAPVICYGVVFARLLASACFQHIMTSGKVVGHGRGREFKGKVGIGIPDTTSGRGFTSRNNRGFFKGFGLNKLMARV